jgi:hypothetical protein
MDNGFSFTSMDTNMQCPTLSGLPHKKEVNGVAFHVINQFAINVIEDVINDYVTMNATNTRKTQSRMCAKSIGDGNKVSTNCLEHCWSKFRRNI